MTAGATRAHAARRGNGRWIPVSVIAAIGLAVLGPTIFLSRSHDRLAPIALPSTVPPARMPLAATTPRGWSRSVDTLILYDPTGPWGWLGELYGTMTANLAGHFGRWTAKPVAEYRRGDVDRHTATIYIGSTYSEPLPLRFLDDILAARRPVIWAGANIGELKHRAGDFASRYGWQPGLLDHTPFAEVRYKNTTLSRWTRKTGGLTSCRVDDPVRATVLARAVHGDRMLPWAIRSRLLTYVAEVPFAYMSETDRTLVFDDLLFDALAPRTHKRHRALLRLEDIDPTSDPKQLRAAADYLHAQRIPFGFGVIPRYRDPTGGQNGGEPRDISLTEAPAVLSAVRYMISRGGVLIDHGYTHQWDGGDNPYDGATGDDVEFYRVVDDRNGRAIYRGPLPGDSFERDYRRLLAARREFGAVGLVPRIFEFPHYAASRPAYEAAARLFAVRWERSFYFPGQLSGHDAGHARPASQFFPFAVRDVYGSKVLPENVGGVTPHAWHGYKARMPADIVRAARAQLVVRDNVVGVFFHPFLKVSLLRRTVEGIRRLGYVFVSPTSL